MDSLLCLCVVVLSVQADRTPAAREGSSEFSIPTGPVPDADVGSRGPLPEEVLVESTSSSTPISESLRGSFADFHHLGFVLDMEPRIRKTFDARSTTKNATEEEERDGRRAIFVVMGIVGAVIILSAMAVLFLRKR